jgi:uncharacterized membrane protein (UPF0182 family)
MPVDIRGDAENIGHLRYPEDMFNAQTSMFEKYHVNDPVVFFNKSDVWLVPQNAGTTSGSGTNPPEQLALEAYYVQMRMPGQTNPEFLLLQPMALGGRKNMIAWVAAHNDPSAYGKVSVYDFPVSSNVIGPEQMEGLVASNPDISKDISLWAQGGSQVILGNLLVLPLQNSLLYVEPVYIVSTQTRIPVFQRVIVGTPTQVVWAASLQDALNLIYAGQGSTGPSSSASPGASPRVSATPGTAVPPTPTAAATSTGSLGPLPSLSLSGNAQQLIVQADQHYQAAQAALRAGDLGTYQKEMDIVGRLLTQLQTVLGTPAPSTK